MTQQYIRINPRCKRHTSVVMGRSFERKRNWYGPVDDDDPDIAKLLKKLRTISDNDSNPAAGQPVFQIRERQEAEQVEQVELEVEDPRGTVANPAAVPAAPEPTRRRHTADDVDAGDEDAAPARRRRRRRSGGE